MTNEQIQQLIHQGEGERTEFKLSLSDLNRIVEVVTSFANAKGGTVIVGKNGSGKSRVLNLLFNNESVAYQNDSRLRIT
nr:hypothetical protein [Desulfobacterales bacterium]